MLQEDSNGETFEIIDKKTEELSITEKTGWFVILTFRIVDWRFLDSLSSMSSSASLLPSPSVSLSTVPSGNLLSNVPPPTALPSFVPTIMNAPLAAPFPAPIPTQPPHTAVSLPTAIDMPGCTEPFYPTQFRFVSTQFVVYAN